jgi:acyl-coenzyme A synthetase/AMP-(fatty) acid ligase
VEGVLCMGRPWPGIARTVYNDHQRYLKTYMTAYKGACADTRLHVADWGQGCTLRATAAGGTATDTCG